eukprot:TRINITY_DN61923_c0_g1_i1.p1 TRINITY_DN61923_c0_g1~~TRINITY_DN61923_c0_g1_i1.p1  ORF type:complete len:145 (-),score=16.71 TRINITY_DN61923_c0_g1_i1:99-488(-)
MPRYCLPIRTAWQLLVGVGILGNVVTADRFESDVFSAQLSNDSRSSNQLEETSRSLHGGESQDASLWRRSAFMEESERVANRVRQHHMHSTRGGRGFHGSFEGAFDGHFEGDFEGSMDGHFEGMFDDHS